MRPALLLFALATAAATACGRGGRAALPDPEAEVAVAVDNQNFLDMDVFLIRGGQRVRIGSVPGLTQRILTLRPDIIGYATELQFEVHPIGGGGNPISETITVRPGDVIHLTIPST